ncbi:hypothetical protein CPB83DRAFT_838654 [Crepidotus variabilis]|uniref:Uncharacterized protein n=1 Tax=Crepidotus variabilis TaxID=179855 RepID=A0A9P6JKZ7_9AGAR|nr:hypothetical protein CPB83DRAFT_838654 [Crepidotus variabilis]
MATRSVIVDDSSSLITYQGDTWFEYPVFDTQFGRFGTPIGSKLHGTGQNASFSFAFAGTAVSVWGPNELTSNVTWECFVDGINTSNSDIIVLESNPSILCDKGQLEDKSHTLTLSAVVPTDDEFWFDQIQYTPSPEGSLENQMIFIESNDPEITYGSGWVSMDGIGYATKETSSTFDFEFTGVSLSWYSWLSPDFSTNLATASYTIDKGSPNQLNVTGPFGVQRMTPTFNLKLFETPTLEMGQHTLSVVYNGNENTAPLSLNYLIVQNGTSTSSNDPSTANINHNSKRNVGAIVGGVISGAVFIACLVFGLAFLRKRRRERQIRHHRRKYSNLDRDLKYLK